MTRIKDSHGSILTMTHKQAKEQWIKRMTDPYWRLNHLYYIKDKAGRKVLFKMNEHQKRFYKEQHTLSLILKSRQLGFSTLIDLIILDSVLFNCHKQGAIIAQSREDAQKIFDEKVKFPWDNLPAELRALIGVRSDTVRELKFGNGSSMRVGTSLRSSTTQYLHITEFGAICSRYPKKAREIVTGALNTVDVGQKTWIESTAEGRSGYFYDYVQKAKAHGEAGKKFTDLDFKLFFYPWYDAKEYRLEDFDEVIPQKYLEYFQELKKEYGIELDQPQKAWYYKKASSQGEDMKREYPSTIDEAFESANEGRFFAEHLSQLRKAKRIGLTSFDPDLTVFTSWDLGRSDPSVIWFFQLDRLGQPRWIDFYNRNHTSLHHYPAMLKEKAKELGYQYEAHFLPHDVAVTDLSSEVSRKQILEDLGVSVTIVPRTKIFDQIETAKGFLVKSFFNEAACEEGLAALDAFHAQWNADYQRYDDDYVHDWSSHASSAFMTGCLGIKLFGSSLGGTKVEDIYQRNRSMRTFV